MAFEQPLRAIPVLALSYFAGFGFADDMHRERHEKAVRTANLLLRQLPSDATPGRTAGVLLNLADAQLRAGMVDQSIESFERALEKRPELKPDLWAYGIALFLADRYEDGARLFELHRTVNPNDVENAAWHFACIAQAKDLGTARAMILPAPNDPRVPMEQVLERLGGGSDQSILDSIERYRNHPRGETVALYGHLYLAMIGEAEHLDTAKILSHSKAAASVGDDSYMADIARVYHERLRRKSSPSTASVESPIPATNGP